MATTTGDYSNGRRLPQIAEPEGEQKDDSKYPFSHTTIVIDSKTKKRKRIKTF